MYLHSMRRERGGGGGGLQIQVVFTVNRGWGIYNIRRSNTKGRDFPKKGAPPPLSHTSYWISRPFGLDSAVAAFRAVTLGAAWDVGMACNVFKLLELLWPHPPDVQDCTSLYAVNSCSPYTVYGIGQGSDLLFPPPIHPLVCPREKASSIPYPHSTRPTE